MVEIKEQDMDANFMEGKICGYGNYCSVLYWAYGLIGCDEQLGLFISTARLRLILSLMNLVLLVVVKRSPQVPQCSLAIPDEYLLKFHNVPDAKPLWAAIKYRFGGNEESKKMQKNVLKHQFENFVIASNETLDKAYDRFQKLISQLEIPGAYVSKEDINQKFLRSLPPSWSQIALIMRNKPDIDEIDIDDLYNNLKVYEGEMKKSSTFSSNTQNLAFLSSENTNSTTRGKLPRLISYRDEVDMELGIGDGDDVRVHVEINPRDVKDDTEGHEADTSAGDTVEVDIDLMSAPIVEEEIVEPAEEDPSDSSGTRDGIVRSFEDMPIDLDDAVHDFYHYMSEVSIDRIIGIETVQRRLEADQLIARGQRVSMVETIDSLRL
ncbi:hypothetical protein Tco_1576716 [Tanacetum coccineum]